MSWQVEFERNYTGDVDEIKAKHVGFRPVSVRSCLVTLTEPDGPSHRVQVEAETLYEAAALGLAAFKRHVFGGTIGPATRLEIQILEPSVVHTLSVQQVQRWLSGATASPNERVRKDKLKSLLA